MRDFLHSTPLIMCESGDFLDQNKIFHLHMISEELYKDQISISKCINCTTQILALTFARFKGVFLYGDNKYFTKFHPPSFMMCQELYRNFHQKFSSNFHQMTQIENQTKLKINQIFRLKSFLTMMQQSPSYVLIKK